VIVDSVYFGDSKRESSGSNGAPQADPPAQPFQVLVGDDETLPF
jgi:hypothetical protein